MNIDFTGRNIEITPAIRDYAGKLLGKLEKILDGPLDAHIVLFVEKHRHVAEVQLKSRAGTFSGQEETGDLYASINEAIDKVERQVRRHKDKRNARRRREAPRAAEVAVAMGEEAPPPPVAEAEAIVDSRPRRIIRSARYRLKPLTPEDAVLELESSGHDILVFRDSLTYRVNVVHRLEDGNFGLVDPEF
jgi:putative sigma-54 modulation protein